LTSAKSQKLAYDLTEPLRIVAELKKEIRQAKKSIQAAAAALLRVGYPKEDVESKLLDSVKDLEEEHGLIKSALKEKGLSFSKSERIKLKAERLLKAGHPTTKIPGLLYKEMANHATERHIRRECRKLGLTDKRFSNKRFKM